jgi:hypothetical protein
MRDHIATRGRSFKDCSATDPPRPKCLQHDATRGGLPEAERQNKAIRRKHSKCNAAAARVHKPPSVASFLAEHPNWDNSNDFNEAV